MKFLGIFIIIEIHDLHKFKALFFVLKDNEVEKIHRYFSLIAEFKLVRHIHLSQILQIHISNVDLSDLIEHIYGLSDLKKNVVLIAAHQRLSSLVPELCHNYFIDYRATSIFYLTTHFHG